MCMYEVMHVCCVILHIFSSAQKVPIGGSYWDKQEGEVDVSTIFCLLSVYSVYIYYTEDYACEAIVLGIRVRVR